MQWHACLPNHGGAHAGEEGDGGEALTVCQTGRGGAFGGGDNEAERWPEGIEEGSNGGRRTPRAELGGGNGDGGAGERRAVARERERRRERVRLREEEEASALAPFAAPAVRRRGRCRRAWPPHGAAVLTAIGHGIAIARGRREGEEVAGQVGLGRWARNEALSLFFKFFSQIFFNTFLSI